MAEIDKMYVGIYADPKGMKKGLDKAKGQMKSFGSQMKGIGSKLFGALGIAGGFIMVTQQIKRAVDEAKRFEKTMTNVKTLLSVSERQTFGGFLDEGSAKIMREFGFEIEDTNKALFDAISAGVKVGNSIEFLEEAARLATAGVTSLSIAVDGMTSIMNAYGIAVEDTTKVSAAFFTAQKFGKTTVEELALNVGMVAPIAKQAGVSFEELLTAMAELTKQGLRTDLAATAIRATLSGLLSPAEEARKKFEKLEIAVGATAIKQRGFFNVLGDISNATKENADVLTELIPNVRALAGVGALGTEQLEDMDFILQQVTTDLGENSSYMSAFNDQMETASKRLDTAKSSAAEFRRELGERLLPVWVGFMESLFPPEGESRYRKFFEQFSIEFKQAMAEADQAMAGFMDWMDESTWKDSGFAELAEKADAAMAEFNITTKKEIVTLADLNKQLEEAEKAVEGMDSADKNAITRKNIKIQAIKDEIEALENLGKVTEIDKYKPGEIDIEKDYDGLITDEGIGAVDDYANAVYGLDYALRSYFDGISEGIMKQKAFEDTMKAFSASVTDMSVNFMADLGEAVGYFMFATDQMEAAMDELAYTLADFMSIMGTTLIKLGIATGNFVALIAGTALKIGSGMMRGALSQEMEEPDIKGRPNDWNYRVYGQNAPGQLTARVSGRDLEIILNRAQTSTAAIT